MGRPGTVIDQGIPLMYTEKPVPPTVETCPHKAVRPGGSQGTAICGILQEILGAEQVTACTVARDACQACCRSFPPSAMCWNPVIASLVYEGAPIAIEAAPVKDLDGLRRLRERALDRLEVVYIEPLPAIPPDACSQPPLLEVLPPPRTRHGATARRWAVGVITAPRIQSTLESCLESLVRAGWQTPHLFVDCTAHVPPQFSHLPGTFHDARIGAWPNYYLALGELLLRHPDADAYLVTQDDALFYDRESLPQYLEKVLWPGTTPALLSLYCAADDCGSRNGWHSRLDQCNTGPVALVFPRELAKAFLTDSAVFEHRWSPDPVMATALGGVVTRWASDQRIPLWFPTPSLVQHIGDTSTLWPRARALGHRRAADLPGIRGETNKSCRLDSRGRPWHRGPWHRV